MLKLVNLRSNKVSLSLAGGIRMTSSKFQSYQLWGMIKVLHAKNKENKKINAFCEVYNMKNAYRNEY